jgi:hypothetical protein
MAWQSCCSAGLTERPPQRGTLIVPRAIARGTEFGSQSHLLFRIHSTRKYGLGEGSSVFDSAG